MSKPFAPRFGIDLLPMDSQQLDLLECLVRIDQNEMLDPRAAGLVERLVDAGLAERTELGILALTVAGIDRCRSLQLRLASDAEAEKVLAERNIPVESARRVIGKVTG